MTLQDRLSRLSFISAVKLLGPRGKKLIMQGGRYDINIPAQVEFSSNVFRLDLGEALVSIIGDEKCDAKMRFLCSDCEGVCEHIGAAVALVLEEKTAVGLAAPPRDDSEPLDLSDEELAHRELQRRIERSRAERLRLTQTDKRRLWSDYMVYSAESGKTYRVALRGWGEGESYCTCPDFRKNTLGTCKHVLFVSRKAKKLFPGWRRIKPYSPNRTVVHLTYGPDIQLRLQASQNTSAAVRAKLNPFLNKPITDIARLMQCVSECIGLGEDILIYPDAEQYINLHMHGTKLRDLVEDVRRNPERHPMRTSLLKTDLLPYQLDGIAFAAGTGRAVLADDMGLGKTIQGIGVAELLARECDISKTLVVCPASVKSQWLSEIGRFSGRSGTVVVGSAGERAGEYRKQAFFTACNYEQVLKDLTHIERVGWDLIILDEGQRIKNWQAKTSRTIKGLRSPYALVLSGTPLENRLDELYSVIEFIDDRRLGPDYLFHRRHTIANDRGRILGYKNLNLLREMIAPVLLRRTRGAVMKQLPPRTSQIVRVTPTGEQIDIHKHNINIVAQIVNKAYISEMDLLRLQKALLTCRMCADSTFLVDKVEPGFSSKLERLEELPPALAAEEGRKALLFSMDHDAWSYRKAHFEAEQASPCPS